MAERLSAAEEAAQVKAVHQDTLAVDTIWSLIDAKWFETWCHYTGFNITTGEIEASKGGRPGTIDNSRLCDANGDLKKDITEHLDYNLVHSDVANLLYTWYGGGPRIDRKVITQGFRNKTKIDLYPYILYTSNILPNGDVDLTNLKSEEMSSKTTLASLRTSFHEDDLKNAAASATGETKGEYDSKSESDSIRFWMEVVEEKTSTSSSSSNGGPILALPYYGASTNGITANPAVKSLDDDDEMEDVPLNGLHVSKAKAEKMEDTLAGITDATGVDTSSTQVEGESHAVDVDAPPPKKIRKSDNYKLISNDDYIRPLESFPFTRTSPLLIERRNADGTWPRASYIKDWREFEIGDVIDCLDTVNKWYESTVRDVKDGKIFIHFNAWASNWDEWIPIDSDRLAAKNTHSVPRTIPTTSTSYGGYGGGYGYSGYGQSERGTPVVPGAVGLRNLGNTCFMNSTLQCMAHTPLVMDYFLDDDYLAEINRDNPLGWQGRIAEEYGKLVKEYWSGEYTIVAPTKFKEVLGEFQPRFSGYQQQDSSELLSFLLDGLHEDLNRVRKKPPTSAIESNNRPDAIVAREAWDTYLLRNRSIVVDALQGQLKSKLVCPIETCGKVSITFDPYMFLSVPMPTINDTVQLIHVVFADATKPITIYGPVVSKVARMTELKEALSRLCDIPSRRMILADVWSHRIYKFLDDDICVSEIRANDLIYCYEVPELDNFKSNEYVPVQVLNQRTEDNPHYNPEYTHMRKITAELFGIPRVIVLPKKEPVTGEKIRTYLDDALSACLRAGATPDSYKLVQLENDGRNCYRCPYLNHCTGCEVPSDENIFDLGLENRRDTDIRVAFGAQWMNLDAYDSTRLDQMIRHTTADDHSEANKKHDTVALTDCIQAFTKEEILSENDPWYCSSCKEFRCASKKMDLYSLPNIFIIHLKRFSYTRLWRDKISTFVDFPIEGLDLAPYAMGEKDEGRPALYDLYAVSNHMGGLGGGHYNAYVRNMENGHWYLHDDSRVSEVQESEIKSSSAYVLFYRRREFIKNKPS